MKGSSLNSADEAGKCVSVWSHAEHTGRLSELQKPRDAEDLSAGELRLQEAKSHHSALPIPERDATQDEVDKERNREKAARSEYEANEAEIQRARGRLEQVVSDGILSPRARLG
jgi:hypothetical protein